MKWYDVWFTDNKRKNVRVVTVHAFDTTEAIAKAKRLVGKGWDFNSVVETTI